MTQLNFATLKTMFDAKISEIYLIIQAKYWQIFVFKFSKIRYHSNRSWPCCTVINYSCFVTCNATYCTEAIASASDAETELLVAEVDERRPVRPAAESVKLDVPSKTDAYNSLIEQLNQLPIDDEFLSTPLPGSRRLSSAYYRYVPSRSRVYCASVTRHNTL